MPTCGHPGMTMMMMMVVVKPLLHLGGARGVTWGSCCYLLFTHTHFSFIIYLFGHEAKHLNKIMLV
jgi:hypothetical protein